MLPIVIAAALLTDVSSEASDPRADDAAAVFSTLCIGTYAGAAGELEPSRFEVTKLDEATARRIKPRLAKQTIWDVHGIRSDVSMLVHNDPAGACVVEIAEADETAVRRAFERAAANAASALGAPATPQPVQTKHIEGKDATAQSWRYRTTKGDVLIVLTTYPDPKFMVQHIATISYVR